MKRMAHTMATRLHSSLSILYVVLFAQLSQVKELHDDVSVILSLSEESDNVSIPILLMFTDSSLRSE